MSLRGPSPWALLISSFTAVPPCVAATAWKQLVTRSVGATPGLLTWACVTRVVRGKRAAQPREAGGQTTRSECSLLRCKSVTSDCYSFTGSE